MSDQATLDFLGRLSQQHRRSAAPGTGGRVMRMQRKDRVSAAYDAAQTTPHNEKYWANADLLSADAANNPDVRRTLRSRARYECFEANSHAKHIVHTLANDLIGSGPRLQVLLGSDDRAHVVLGREDPGRVVSTQIERAFNGWARQIHLARKLRTLKLARTVDGEGFAHLTTNRRLPAVQLDLVTIEADQIASPTLFYESDRAVDGIVYDADGNPRIYHKLKAHPGAMGQAFAWDKDDVPADAMLHTFRQDRPGQRRGISEVTTALPLFALLRDFTLAVLHNARSAAKFTAILETQSGAFGDDTDTGDQSIVDAFDAVDIDYDMMTALPYGYALKQLRAEQPTTTFGEFKKAILTEIAACVSMPLNIALGDSSDFNYASGRLDHQTYFKSIEVERSEWEIDVLDRLFAAWLEEAMFVPGLLPAGLPPFAELRHEWFWDGREHVDPAKESIGQKTRLGSGTTHRAREYGRIGLDIDEEDRVAAESYGVTVEEYRRALFAAHFASPTAAATDDPPDDDDEDEDGEESTAGSRQSAATSN